MTVHVLHQCYQYGCVSVYTPQSSPTNVPETVFTEESLFAIGRSDARRVRGRPHRMVEAITKKANGPEHWLEIVCGTSPTTIYFMNENTVANGNEAPSKRSKNLENKPPGKAKTAEGEKTDKRKK